MKEVAAALVAAQKAFAPLIRNAENPHRNSKYADLAACVDAVIKALNENGIALIQRLHTAENGVAVETMFIHQSGETISAGIFTVPSAKMDAQGYGSALTYARRYSLMAACGIAPEDDDGNAASTKEDVPQPRPMEELKKLIKEAGEDWKTVYAEMNSTEQKLIREEIKKAQKGEKK